MKRGEFIFTPYKNKKEGTFFRAYLSSLYRLLNLAIIAFNIVIASIIPATTLLLPISMYF